VSGAAGKCRLENRPVFLRKAFREGQAGLVHLPVGRRRRLSRQTRWDGGVRRLLPEMTYTATGFSNPVRVVFDALFRPTTVEDSRESIAEHFHTAIRRERLHVYVLDRLLLQPVVRTALMLSALLARMHHGRINTYIAYVLLSLLAVLVVHSASQFP